MHARVARFESRDQSIPDELIGKVREQVDSGAPPPGAQGMLMLVDRDAGTSAGITFFDNEQAIKDAEPAFEAMGASMPEELRGKRVSVEAYEVLLIDGEPGKAARVSSLQGSPDNFDEAAKTTQEVVPTVRQMPGSTGVLSLADRASGRALIVTLWENEEAMRAGEEQANQLRRQAAEGSGGEIVSVERFEVAIARMPAAVS
jgi:heme-degrading monooxygenase HmoA